MIRIFGIVSVICICLLSLTTASSAQNKQPKKQIAITFNDLPAAEGFRDTDRDAITYLTLQALRKHDIKTVGFVVGNQIEESFDALGEWLNDGHKLGNMTFSKQDYNQLGIEQFITDIREGEQALDVMLDGFGQTERYFRYPYLHYGNDVRKKKQVQMYLDAQGYVIGHVTVVVDDYLYNLTLEKMGKEPDSQQYIALLNEYINHVLDQIEHAEHLSQQMFQRYCRQILQLSANRLNAVFLDEMLTAIENMGYEFITLDNALGDELFMMPEGYFGSRGVGYLEMLYESNADFLPAR